MSEQSLSELMTVVRSFLQQLHELEIEAIVRNDQVTYRAVQEYRMKITRQEELGS